jgi:hypothetical protein
MVLPKYLNDADLGLEREGVREMTGEIWAYSCAITNFLAAAVIRLEATERIPPPSGFGP